MKEPPPASQLRAIAHLCYFNGIVPLWRTPLLFGALFLTPFTFLFFLFIITRAGDAGATLLPVGVVGGVLFTVLFTGNGMLNDCAYLRLERQLQQVFVASPVRPFSYLLGLALSELAYAVPALVLFLAVLDVIHPFGIGALLVLIGVILLVWLMATTLGFLISTMFNQLREIWPIATLTFSTLSVLPPLFYPISAIPSGYQWVAFLAPSTYGGQLAEWAVGLPRGSITPSLLGAPLFDLVGLVGFTAVFSLAATFLARWRE
jgi:ABC-2 type transport system permease protein